MPMADMLITLYDVPAEGAGRASGPAVPGVAIRKPWGPEHRPICAWVEAQFGATWAGEVAVALANQPVTAFIALRERVLIGFACYDATALGFFGPGGVAEDLRRRGIGTALLHACLRDMRSKGYGYAIVGGVGPAAFYRQAVGAVEIPGSTPGLYGTLLRTSA